jgi:hypothetical protein
MLILGLIAICASYLAMAAFLILTARAALSLRLGVGKAFPYGALVSPAAYAVVPGQQRWRRRVDPEYVKHFEQFGRRIRIALALLGTPLFLAALLRLL